jgi:transposase-like protein
MMAITRELRGKKIATMLDQIERVGNVSYRVKSQSGNGWYDVTFSTLNGWDCTCPDHVFRLVECKHIWAVMCSFAIRKEVEANVIEPSVDVHACLSCKSEKLIRFGLRHNKYGDLQKFSCKSCGKVFTVNLGFEKMKHNPQGITTAMQLYFAGESLRNVAKSLKLIGVQVSHQTVYNWIEKYTALMEKYLDKITPQVSNTWRADELFLKVKGNMRYLYALMDDQTRFWIAQEVMNTKYVADVQPLFAEGKRRTGIEPKYIITDGARNYDKAIRKEFHGNFRYAGPKHVSDIRFDGTVHNNKMERLNGEIRDREKVMRSLKKTDTPILTGMQIYHNYVRPHMGLDGKTPAEKAGIDVKGQDKWLTIIQNASKKNESGHSSS